MKNYDSYFYNGATDEFGPIIEDDSIDNLVDFYADEMWVPEETTDKTALRETIERIRNERANLLAERYSRIHPIGMRASWLRDQMEREELGVEEECNAQTGYLRMKIDGQSMEVRTEGPDAGYWRRQK